LKKPENITNGTQDIQREAAKMLCPKESRMKAGKAQAREEKSMMLPSGFGICNNANQAVTQISCQRFAFASESSLRLPCVFVSVSVPSAQLPNCPSVCVCGGASARVFVKARIAVLQLLRSEIAEPGEK